MAGERFIPTSSVVHGDDVWRARLALRDRMRADADAAARHGRLKTSLATPHRDGREVCTAAKADLVPTDFRRALPRD